MARKASNTGISNSFDEMQPLLGPRTADVFSRVRSDLEEAARTEPEGPGKIWRLIWYLSFNTFLVIWALVTMAKNPDGVGSNRIELGYSPSHVLPQFDFKWALWCALGGGLSGAAGTIILCTC